MQISKLINIDFCGLSEEEIGQVQNVLDRAQSIRGNNVRFGQVEEEKLTGTEEPICTEENFPLTPTSGGILRTMFTQISESAGKKLNFGSPENGRNPAVAYTKGCRLAELPMPKLGYPVELEPVISPSATKASPGLNGNTPSRWTFSQKVSKFEKYFGKKKIPSFIKPKESDSVDSVTVG